MKYIYISGTMQDQEVVESDNLDELIARADSDWAHMWESDRKKITSHYVLESVNPDEDAENHFDGTVMYDVVHGGV